MFKNSFAIILALLFFFSATFFKKDLIENHQSLREDTPPLYLPAINKSKLITLGFNNFVGDLLLFNAVSYFGANFNKKDGIPWFTHMCKLVIHLDPLARGSAEFCSTLNTWVLEKPLESKLLLDQVIEKDPGHWRYWYLRGFTNWYFLDDLEAAKNDFVEASKIPAAPSFLASLASKLIAKNENPRMALAFLDDMIKNSENESGKKALLEKRKLAMVSIDIENINKLIDLYNQRSSKELSSLNDLVDIGAISSLPLDPYREPYFYNIDEKRVESKKGKVGLTFNAKNAKTGVANMDIPKVDKNNE